MRERGFSLVEVLVAVGVTSSILLSIAGLFVMGAKQVQSGRFLTSATQAGLTLAEEMQTWHQRDLWGILNGQPADTSVTWSSDTANPVWDNANADLATDYALILNRWRDQVSDAVPRSGFSLTFDGFENRPVGADDGTCAFEDARFVRGELTIFWTEGSGRNREVTFNLLKF